MNSNNWPKYKKIQTRKCWEKSFIRFVGEESIKIAEKEEGEDEDEEEET